MAAGRALCIGVDAEDDAQTFAGIARRKGFASSSLLLDDDATRAAVRAKLDELAAASEPGDLALISFSGHGGRALARTRAGTAEPMALWQLFDGSLKDEHLKSDLGRFREGVRLLVISDNCSGGIPSSKPNELARSLSASVLVLAACMPDQYADGEGLPGHFAAAVERTWDEGAFSGAYAQFHDALCRAMPEYQRPDYYRIGVPNSAFEAQRPFTI